LVVHDDVPPLPERDSASSPLDAETVEALFRNHAQALRWFIRGIVRDPETAEDVLQTTFTRLIEHGGPDQTDPASRKSWLFQVAHHEAIAQKRKGRLRERANRDARLVRAADSGNQDTAEDHLQRAETIARVRQAVEALPPAQRDVVLRRLAGRETFAAIAQADGLPLGTVLTRMRLALGRLRSLLDSHRDPSP